MNKVVNILLKSVLIIVMLGIASCAPTPRPQPVSPSPSSGSQPPTVSPPSLPPSSPLSSPFTIEGVILLEGIDTAGTISYVPIVVTIDTDRYYCMVDNLRSNKTSAMAGHIFRLPIYYEEPPAGETAFIMSINISCGIDENWTMVTFEDIPFQPGETLTLPAVTLRRTGGKDSEDMHFVWIDGHEWGRRYPIPKSLP